MEGKTLHFDKPLPSARRFRWKVEDSFRTARRPPYESELQSGPVSNQGAVPFVWEQIPERHKDDERRVESHVAESYEVPKVPSATPVVHKDQSRSVSHDSDQNAKLSLSFRDGEEEGENEEILDSLATVSRADSLLTNCSRFGGLETPDMIVSGTSPIDSQTRDFMIGRFLPAAKAMELEMPDQPVVHQQSRELHKLVNGDKGPQLRYGPDYALEYLQCNGDGDEESDADYDEEEKFHGKARCLLPGLGLRRSCFLLKLLPRMSKRSCAPTTPPTKSQIKTSSWCCSKPDFPSFRELSAGKNQSDNLGIASSVAEKTLYIDTEPKVRSLHVKSCTFGANGQTGPEVKKHEILTKKEAKSEHKFQVPDFTKPSEGGADHETKIAMQRPSIQEQDMFESSKMPEEKCTKVCPKVLRNPEESKMYSELQDSPPLIKSPSDSWLGRMLPTISRKNTSVHSHRGTWMTPKENASKVKSPNPKWETMVTMTKMQDMQLCFSEGRLTPIPEA